MKVEVHSSRTDHFLTFAVPVIRPCASLKVIVLPETELVPLILPDESRYVVEPVDEVDAVPLILPWASRKVVDDPLPLDVPAIRP